MVDAPSYAPLSYAQRRLWFLDQLTATAAYNVPVAWRLRGRLDVAALQSAVEAAVARHEVLRTTYQLVGDEVVQVVHPPAVVELAVTPASSEDDAKRIVSGEAHARFDLANGPVLRAGLVRLAEGDHVFVLVLHHICTDGWSMRIVVDEIARDYAALVAGEADRADAGPPPTRYGDYAIHQRRRFEGGDDRAGIDRHLAYWRERLAGAPAVVELPRRGERPSVETHAGAAVPVHVPAALAVRLRELAKSLRATPFMVLLAAFQAVVHLYSGEDDVVVGSPVAGRTDASLEGVVGCFVNMLALRTSLGGDPTFADLVRRVRATVVGALEHQDVPFERLVDELDVERDPSRNPLFQIVFASETEDAADRLRLPDLEADRFPTGQVTSKFDLTLSLAAQGEAFTGSMEYATDLYDGALMRRVARRLVRVLHAVTERPALRLSDLRVPDAAELGELTRWNAPPLAVPERCMHELFEDQVARRPGAPAVVAGRATIDYRTLDERANRLAHRLRAAGSGPGRVVGVCARRSIDLVVGLLGTLKAGAAYLPLDPDHPPARTRFELADAGVRTVVTTSSSADALDGLAVDLIVVDDARVVAELDALPSTPVPPRVSPGDAAYVMYTSGSTGEPKGVVVPHAGVVNRLAWAQHTFALDPDDRVLQKTPVTFDVSVPELFWTLGWGATLVLLADGAHRDPEQLRDALDRQGVTVVHFVPSMLHAYLDAVPDDLPATVRLVLLSGEALPGPLAARLAARTRARIVNLYGPTEASVDVTAKTLTPGDAQRAVVPIGRPISNVSAYVLDGSAALVPLGARGELAVGGVALAHGYLGRPALTAERFVPDPFAHGGRLYRTGDVVRWTEGGELEYLGRDDDQVKVRGVRVELGEIDAVLERHPAVGACATVVREDRPGDRRLVSYVVVRPPVPAADELRAHLTTHLPEHAVPSAFVAIDALPTTTSGKIDRSALPAPDTRPELRTQFVPPRSPLERALATVWCDVIGIDRVGIHDDFFELGGDSITSIRLVRKARAAGIAFPVTAVFRHPTIAALAAVATQVQDRPPVNGDDGVGDAPLTPIQAWLLEGHDEVDVRRFDQSLVLEAAEPLDARALEAALRAVVAHHGQLRARFEMTGGEWRQRVAPPTADDVTVIRVPGWTDPSGDACAVTTLRSQLDIAAGLTFVAGMPGAPGEAGYADRLALVAHHLVVDAISWSVVLDDLAVAYDHASRGEPIALPAPTTSFVAWANRSAPERRARRRPGAARSPWATAAGAARPERASASLPARATSALLRDVPRRARTNPAEVLVAAVAQSVAQITGATSFAVAVEGHGRDHPFDDVDLSRSVGWFTTLSTFVVEVTGDVALDVRLVKERLRAAPPSATADAAICVNYFGRAAPFPTCPPFVAVRPVPPATCLWPLVADAAVADGSLHVSLATSGQVSPADLHRLASLTIERLEAIVDGCTARAASALAPSDFPLARLDGAQLDRLLARVQEDPTIS